VIKGIPCGFMQHNTGGGEDALTERNIRSRVWRNMTKLEAFKCEIIADFNEKLGQQVTPIEDGLPKLTIQQV
jgi:hypothetical protein